MNMNWIKTVTKLLSKSKDAVIKHAPQLMAVAGAGCFMAATYCAVKETPGAMDALEKKESIDDGMTPLQKAAVVVPKYKKTFVLTAAGLGFTFGAWKVESVRVAEMAGLVAAYAKDNDRVIEAAKEVVGEEKAKEIIEKKNEILAEDLQVDAHSSIPSDLIPYPFMFPNGTEVWMSWHDFKARLEECVKTLAINKELSVYEILAEMKAKFLPEDQRNNGWQIDASSLSAIADAGDALDWAYEQLDYTTVTEVYDEDRHIVGYKVYWMVPPKPMKFGVC